jgi:hypothetical protein
VAFRAGGISSGNARYFLIDSRTIRTDLTYNQLPARMGFACGSLGSLFVQSIRIVHRTARDVYAIAVAPAGCSGETRCWEWLDFRIPPARINTGSKPWQRSGIYLMPHSACMSREDAPPLSLPRVRNSD